jgi:hypothetical protein
MPTYQSAPNYPVVFPDQEVSRNPYGFKTMKGNTILVRGDVEAGHSSHPKWKEEADRVVLDRVKNTKLAKENMLKQPASRKGLHGYTTYNGSFESIRGGTVWSKQAENMVTGLIRDRKFQLDALGQATFDSIPQNRLGVNVPPAETFKTDRLFLDILSNLTVGNLKPMYGELGSLFSELMTSAYTLPDAKLDEYYGYISQIQSTLSVYGDENYELLSASAMKNINSLAQRYARLQTFFKKLLEYKGRPSKEKELALSNMRASLLADSQEALQKGALGLIPELETARETREQLFQEGMVGRPPVRRRERALAAERALEEQVRERLSNPTRRQARPAPAEEEEVDFV